MMYLETSLSEIKTLNGPILKTQDIFDWYFNWYKSKLLGLNRRTKTNRPFIISVKEILTVLGFFHHPIRLLYPIRSLRILPVHLTRPHYLIDEG